MTIHQRMAQIFQEAEIPGFLQEWRATKEYPKIPDKYCTYIVTVEDDGLCADDMEILHRTSLYLHMYGKTDISTEHDRLRAVLSKHGFYFPRTRDLDDIRAGEYQYHKRLDLILVEDAQQQEE